MREIHGWFVMDLTTKSIIVGEYYNKDLEDIINIIEYLDCHTMTVELISKYLRDSSNTPNVLLQKLKKFEGITETIPL